MAHGDDRGKCGVCRKNIFSNSTGKKKMLSGKGWKLKARKGKRGNKNWKGPEKKLGGSKKGPEKKTRPLQKKDAGLAWGPGDIESRRRRKAQKVRDVEKKKGGPTDGLGEGRAQGEKGKFRG